MHVMDVYRPPLAIWVMLQANLARDPVRLIVPHLPQVYPGVLLHAATCTWLLSVAMTWYRTSSMLAFWTAE